MTIEEANAALAAEIAAGTWDWRTVLHVCSGSYYDGRSWTRHIRDGWVRHYFFPTKAEATAAAYMLERGIPCELPQIHDEWRAGVVS